MHLRDAEFKNGKKIVSKTRPVKLHVSRSQGKWLAHERFSFFVTRTDEKCLGKNVLREVYQTFAPSVGHESRINLTRPFEIKPMINRNDNATSKKYPFSNGYYP